MFIPLTAQEKKVLGFISFLLFLGTLILTIRHFTQVPIPGGEPAVSPVQK